MGERGREEKCQKLSWQTAALPLHSMLSEDSLCLSKKGVDHPETNYHSWFLPPQSKLQTNGFSRRNMHVPEARCMFLQKHAAFGGILQETAGRCRRVSGLKNQERQRLVSRVMGNLVTYQAVLPGVPFTGVQVLRSKKHILLHEKRVLRTATWSKIARPSAPPPEALYEARNKFTGLRGTPCHDIFSCPVSGKGIWPSLEDLPTRPGASNSRTNATSPFFVGKRYQHEWF